LIYGWQIDGSNNNFGMIVVVVSIAIIEFSIVQCSCSFKPNLASWNCSCNLSNQCSVAVVVVIVVIIVIIIIILGN